MRKNMPSLQSVKSSLSGVSGDQELRKSLRKMRVSKCQLLVWAGNSGIKANSSDTVVQVFKNLRDDVKKERRQKKEKPKRFSNVNVRASEILARKKKEKKEKEESPPTQKPIVRAKFATRGGRPFNPTTFRKKKKLKSKKDSGFDFERDLF